MFLVEGKKTNTSCFTSQCIGSWYSFPKNIMPVSLPQFRKLFLNFPLNSQLGKSAAHKGMVRPIRLFLMIIMMPLKRCVAKENYLMVLLKNEARNEFLLSGPCLSVAKIWPLSFTVARRLCLYLIFSSCNVKFPKLNWK